MMDSESVVKVTEPVISEGSHTRRMAYSVDKIKQETVKSTLNIDLVNLNVDIQQKRFRMTF